MARATKITMEWDDGMRHEWSRTDGKREFDLALTDPGAVCDAQQPLRVSGYDLENLTRVIGKGYEGDRMTVERVPVSQVVRLGWQERDLALGDAIGNRDTHIAWRDHLRAHPDDPRVDVVGNLAFHERAVREYDRIVRVLNYALHPQAAEAALADARRAVLAELTDEGSVDAFCDAYYKHEGGHRAATEAGLSALAAHLAGGDRDG